MAGRTPIFSSSNTPAVIRTRILFRLKVSHCCNYELDF
jgi:hypothetical protein